MQPTTRIGGAGRLKGLDALRGVAIVMMVIFHFCFDLTYWRLADFEMLSDWRWIGWRTLIVSLFLFLVGVSLVLGRNVSERHFWRRWSVIAGSALLISLLSWLMFGERFIYFGVLHFIAVAQCFGRWSLRSGWVRNSGWVMVLASILLLSGWLGLEAMNPRWLNWIGLAAHKPMTEDYVPLLPWLGMVLLGIGCGMRWQGRGGQWQPIAPSLVINGLAWLGRHALAIYLLHQPVLMAGLALWVQLGR